MAQVMAAQVKEQAEPKAEQAEGKPKATAKPPPLAKPKAKPQPQFQAPHPIPTPQTWTPPSSSPRRIRFGLSGFCCNGFTTGCWGGGGGWVWVDGRGGPPGQAPAARGGQGVVGVATGVAGAAEEMGGDASPPDMGLKMFELAQTNLFPPERKNGAGAPTPSAKPRWGPPATTPPPTPGTPSPRPW